MAHKSKTTTLPIWGQWAFGIAMMLLAIAAGVVSLVINIEHGLKTGFIAAATYGLSDVGKILIPIVAVAIGWSLHMRVTAIACATISIWCVVNYNADAIGQAFISAETVSERRAGNAEDMSRTRRELAAITETGAAGALSVLVTEATAKAAREESRGGCAKACEAAKADLVKLIERHAQAKRRDELTDTLKSAKTDEAKIGAVEVSGFAAIAAGIFGIDKKFTARVMSAFEIFAKIVLTETLVFLSMPAARLLGQAMKARKPNKEKQVEAPPPPPAKTKAPRIKREPKPKPIALPAPWHFEQGLKLRAGNDNRRLVPVA